MLSAEYPQREVPLQQTFQSRPLENTYDLSILSILILKILKKCRVSLPNPFTTYKNLHTASFIILFPRPSNLICIHFI
jgi:hypothetical protein